MFFLTVGTFFKFDSNEIQASPEKIMEASVKNSDKALQINWKILNENITVDNIEILIKSKSVNHKKKFSADETKYSFVEGKHGNGYDISVIAKNGEKIVEKYDTRAVFLDYDKLPDLPIISINTRNGKYPTFRMANKPHGVLGATSTDNQYLECEMVMFHKEKKIANSSGRFRVRGNTSVKYFNKPYRLELDSASDLLERGNAYADRDWVLLNQGHSLNTYFVTELANLFNVEWQPRIRYVNLIVNGKWDGCYLLSESVKRSRHRLNITRSGYIFEYDPYFWKPNVTYFRTSHTPKHIGFTFKYPKDKNISTNEINNLKQYLQEFEDFLENKDERYLDYIDMDSFSTWIVVHDIIGTLDGAGSNMYFYKYDFDLENPTSTKIKRGPLWDFDSSFRVSDDWSEIHRHAAYLKQLFQIQSFRQAYKDKFNSVKKTIVPELKAKSDEFKKTQASALQESWALHAALWDQSTPNVEKDIRKDLKFLKNKIKWINNRLKTDNWE